MSFYKLKFTALSVPCEPPMTKGLSSESRELRRHLLSHNGPDVADSMAKSGYKDPVGLIIEMTDDVGNAQAPLSRPLWQHKTPEAVLLLTASSAKLPEVSPTKY